MLELFDRFIPKAAGGGGPRSSQDAWADSGIPEKSGEDIIDTYGWIHYNRSSRTFNAQDPWTWDQPSVVLNSYAPISQWEPDGRRTPRWSVLLQAVSSPASIAGL